MEKLYSRVCKTVQDTGKLVESRKKFAWFNEKVKEDPNSDYYFSLYSYPEEVKTHFSEKGNSIKGYSGKGYANYLFWDFDSGTDLSKAKEDVVTLINRLADEYSVSPMDSIKVYFSGGKGFHVYLLLKDYLEQPRIEQLCKAVAQGLPTFDSQIYNIARIIRVPYSHHNKTEYWKVEIPIEQFKSLSIEEIKEKGKVPEKLTRVVKPFEKVEVFDKVEIKEKQVQVVVEETFDASSIRGLHLINFDLCPRNTPRCIFALQKGVMKPGERSMVFLALARYFRNEGMEKQVVYHTLKGISELNHRLYPESEPYTKAQIWNESIASAFSDKSLEFMKPGSPGTKANDGILLKYCELVDRYAGRACCLHKKVMTKEVYNTDLMCQEFTKYALHIDENVIKTGLNFVDESMTISRGEMTLLVGANGSGKTTLALNMLEHASNSGIHAAFFSMDTHRHILFQKLATRCTDFNFRQIKEIFKNDPDGLGKKIKSAVAERYKNVHFFFQSTLSVDEIRDKVLQLNADNSIDIGVLTIDYFGRLSGPHSDAFANARYNALRSKELADTTNTALIMLSQVARQHGDKAAPLRTSRCSKLSGDTEEAAANVVTIWRPWGSEKNADNDNIMKIYLAKNRSGIEKESCAWWNGAKSLVKNMTEEELEDYEVNRSKAEEEKYKARYK